MITVPGAPELDVLTAEGIVAICADGGLRPLVARADVVIAERDIIGVPLVLRRVVCQQDPATGAWRAGVFLRHRNGAHTLVARRGAFRDLLHFELWLGGVLSVQIGPEEVTAIRSQRVA